MCTTLTPFAVPHPKWLPVNGRTGSTRQRVEEGRGGQQPVWPTRAPIKINAGNICDFGGQRSLRVSLHFFRRSALYGIREWGWWGGADILGQSRAKFRISWKPTTIHGSLADLFETRRVLKHLAYFKDNIWLNLKRNSILALYIYSKFSRYRQINSLLLRSNLQNFHKTGHRRVILFGFPFRGPLRQHYFKHIYVYYCVNQGINLK